MVLKHQDWGEASYSYDSIKEFLDSNYNKQVSNEAQTRFDVIDRVIKEVLAWDHGQISVENRTKNDGAIDYVLQTGDYKILIEAKKSNSSFPSVTARKLLKINGSVLSDKEIKKAIEQVSEYGKKLEANVLAVTNGFFWCVFSSNIKSDSVAEVFFLFNDKNSVRDAQRLFDLLSQRNVEKGSLKHFLDLKVFEKNIENRLLSIVNDADARVDRNNVADHINPALAKALFSDSILSDPETLKKVFIKTEGRSKFDSRLEICLVDSKPPSVTPAQRIRTGRKSGKLQNIVENSVPCPSSPVTLIIGPVGSGKTTYLHHFQQISGLHSLKKSNALWIYIDFEAMGREGSPRDFIYNSLQNYLIKNPETVEKIVTPAYKDDIDSLLAGPLSRMRNNKEDVDKRISDFIYNEYTKVEPYVDKIFKYLAKKHVCIIVLDNVDLYEDEELETKVFSEGVALSKKIFAQVIVSLRDTTFVKHKTSSTFDAHELTKLWLDPPQLKAVISERLSYSKFILKGKSARILSKNSMTFEIKDLSIFFDIVQRSVLSGSTGDHIANFADTNTRKGLDLIKNFLVSGHINADRALKEYVTGNGCFSFPPHEIFKGMMLGQWKHFKEGRAECLNIFDSKTSSKKLLLLRLYIISYLYENASHLDTLEVPFTKVANVFAKYGVSKDILLSSLLKLYEYRLIKNIGSDDVTENSTFSFTRCGGYYLKSLCNTLYYIEACLMDTAIYIDEVWTLLVDHTNRIETSSNTTQRMEIRFERFKKFIEYLSEINSEFLNSYKGTGQLNDCLKDIIKRSTQDAQDALYKTYKYYSD